MINLLHVYTSPNHGSLVFYSTDPRDPFTFVDPFDPRPMTDDPLTHCLLCFKVACSTSHKTTDRTLMKILPQMYLCTRKNWLHFGSHPPSDPDPGFFKDSSTLRDLAFFPQFSSHLQNPIRVALLENAIARRFRRMCSAVAPDCGEYLIYNVRVFSDWSSRL